MDFDDAWNISRRNTIGWKNLKKKEKTQSSNSFEEFDYGWNHREGWELKPTMIINDGVTCKEIKDHEGYGIAWLCHCNKIHYSRGPWGAKRAI